MLSSLSLSFLDQTISNERSTRDDPDVSLIQQLVDHNLFYPDTKELELIKRWIIYNLEDISTAHVPELFKFRSTVRYSFLRK